MLPRILFASLLALAAASPALAAEASPAAWWLWPVALFAVSFLLGIVAVLAGVGGGVLFVPLISGFFPFHLDFVRGAGLLLALSGALSAAPALLRAGMANLRLAMPFALVGSITSIGGALLGLALPTTLVQTALGVTILLIAALMWSTKRSIYPEVAQSDRLAEALGLRAVFKDPLTGHAAEWRVHRTAGRRAARRGPRERSFARRAAHLHRRGGNPRAGVPRHRRGGLGRDAAPRLDRERRLRLF